MVALPPDPNDISRLIQEILAELGHNADPAEIARRVRGLDRGLPAEDEFSVLCGWLGRTRLIHKLDQQQVPVASRDVYQAPDLLAVFEASGPVLIEIKVCRDLTMSFRPDYLKKLTEYAQLLNLPLLIAWKFHNVWSLFDSRILRLAKTNFNISHNDAMRQNLIGVLAGDVAYSLGPGSGIHLDCAKEELTSTQDSPDGKIEQWKMRISGVHFTDGVGRRRDDLHPETKQLFAGCDLESREIHAPESIRMSFVAGENQMQFAHAALVHLLASERSTGEEQNWRHLLRVPEVVKSIKDFSGALDRALSEGVVHHILHIQPHDWPDFVTRPS